MAPAESFVVSSAERAAPSVSSLTTLLAIEPGEACQFIVYAAY